MENQAKSINEILNLSDDDYIAYIRTILTGKNALYNMDHLDDELLKIIDRRAHDVERICRINTKVFAEMNRNNESNPMVAYNFNTLLIAAIHQKNVSEVKSIFTVGIRYCRENNHYEAGKSLSQNVLRLFKSGHMPHDEALYFLAQATEFYCAFNNHIDAIEALCDAALHFADASAFQSAYRAIHDAQQIAIAHQAGHSQIHILETQGVVALKEGDLLCAENEFLKCFELCKTIKEAPSFMLKANMALVKLRKKEYTNARDLYQDLINSHHASMDTIQIKQLQINLLIIFRELNDKNALEGLAHQIGNDLNIFNIEERIEARLVLAKSYFHINKLLDGINHLKKACVDIQLQVDQYQRLHYRRGIRERYLSRVRSMLLDVEVSGVAEDILHALVLCSSNALTDWISFLEWSDHIYQSGTIPDSIKKELIINKDALLQFGSPFLYGFKEKYDDPFESPNEEVKEKLGEQAARAMDYSLPWREFNDLTSKIAQAYDYPSAFERANIQYIVSSIMHRMSSGSAFLFSFACKESCIFVFVSGEQYLKKSIPSDNLLEFLKSLYEYQKGNSNRATFHSQLSKLQKCLNLIFPDIISLLESSPISELIFIPDYLTEGSPILPTLIASDQLRSRIKEQKFVFRICPALMEVPAEPLVTGPILCISSSDEHLELAESEKLLIKNTFPDQDFFEIDLGSEGLDFSQPPAKLAKVLHLATHSTPANAFTDPWFVSTSTDLSKNRICLESLQREIHKLQFTLVVLNGCNTGTTSNRNYFNDFSTNEHIGLSSTFLLNRTCSVVATQWNVPEIVGYIYASLLYKRLASQPKAAYAFILALVDLYELNREAATHLLEEIPDENMRMKRSEALKRTSIDFPFRDTYILGMFQYHSLLVKP